jgi:hypothetical protein
MSAPVSPYVAATPLETYQAAVELRRLAGVATDAAKQAYETAAAHAEELRYLATVAIPCPPQGCGAPAGKPCEHGNANVHRYVTHGIRQDLAGVNGEFSRNDVARRFPQGGSA